ncbi:MAG: hypothetical protein OEO83_16990, partial [Alphaproteobacteria bacterium]|nr:hypothetical protein [Alphaproteobacteria bacterium]
MKAKIGRRDIHLLSILMLLSLLAIVVTFYGASTFESQYLRNEVKRIATHWANHMRRNLSDIENLL